MGSDNGLPALAARLGLVAAVLGDTTAMGHAVGKGARTEATFVANSVSGGDAVLSHMGRRGARLSMGYDLEDSGRRVIVKLRPPGPWVLMERGAKPHTIPRATRGRRRGAGARYLMGASYAHPVRAPILHTGAPGAKKQAITRTFGRVRGRASRDWHGEYLKALAKAMS